jgi:transposase-like protein
LQGEVEIDATSVGGPQAGLRGSRRLKGRKAALVIVAVEKRGDATGRARMAVIPDFKAATLTAFLKQNVAPGSTLYTEGLLSGKLPEEAGFKHEPQLQSIELYPSKGGQDERRTKTSVPLANRAIGDLQEWLIGTHHGVSRGQLQVYLDEFVFRHNRRKTPAAAFQTLLGLGTGRKSAEYEQIRGAKDLDHNILGFAESTR